METLENPFIRAISHLESSGVDYVIVGGFAVVMYGCNRFTPDLNVMVSHDSEEGIQSLIDGLVAEEFIASTDQDTFKLLDTQQRETLHDGGRRWFFSFRDLESPSFSLDIFLKFPIPFEQVFSRRTELTVDEQKFYICSHEDLVAMKSLAGRGQDKADIGALQLIQKIQEMRTEGKEDQEILALGNSDAEQEQIEGFLRFVSFTPKEKLEWLAEMLNHLGKFCVA